MNSITRFGLFLIIVITSEAREITFRSRCPFPIWINPKTSDNGPPLPEGIGHIVNGGSFTYHIPAEEWKGRFWPKTDCDRDGQNCGVGQSLPPCPPGGCQPPAETKIEFYYPAMGRTDNVWYDISLVDGYTLPMKITPSNHVKIEKLFHLNECKTFTNITFFFLFQGNTCVTTDCRVDLNDCPDDEAHTGSLRVYKNGGIVQCLAPCKKWNCSYPWGKGLSEKEGLGLQFCCPTPPIYPAGCNRGIVTKTKYVKLIHEKCPSAYAYSYDDHHGLHNCPNPTDFVVEIC